MKMNCKKCGCSTLIAEGDWLRCPQCGAEYFNTRIPPELSVTEKIDLIENGGLTEAEAEKTVASSAAKGIIAAKENAHTEPKKEDSEFTVTELPISHAEQSEESGSAKAAEHHESAIAIQNSNAEVEKVSTAAAGENAATDAEKAEPAGNHTQASAVSNTQASAENNTAQEEKKPSKFKEVVDFLLPIVIAVVIAELLKIFVFANAIVPTGSMIATINIKDRIIASRLAYISDDPERYDIIMFYYPDDETQPFVKRVIGLPGETISMTNGVVYIADESGKIYQTDQSFVNPEDTPAGSFDEIYIPKKGEIITTDGDYCYAENGANMGGMNFLKKYCEQDENGTYTVSDNLYFVMGDNRNNSHDSRAWENKYVAKDKIMGKVLFRYYPGFEVLR